MSLDFLEFLLTSLPEALVDKIEAMIRWLITLKASNRGGEAILGKTSDLFALAQEMLSADVLLPNLVAFITADLLVQSKSFSTIDIQLKVFALEHLRALIEGSEHLDNEAHFESLI